MDIFITADLNDERVISIFFLLLLFFLIVLLYSEIGFDSGMISNYFAVGWFVV